MLTGWRILDLTDHRGEVGPYLLADLGAEVLKVEPLGGCLSRRRGIDELHFKAYNGNKRLSSLTGDADRDRALILQHAASSDLLFDSGPPGRLAELGIDRATLEAANPKIVSVTVTPFGLDGPRAKQPATELTIGALGGSVRLQGTPERAPVKMSVPQIWRHAGAEAAVAALIAHRRMITTGQAQSVDVSAQSVMTWTMLNAMEAKGIQGRDFQRTGSELHLSMTIQLRMPTTDGYAIGVPTGRSLQFLLPWLLDEGIVDQSWAETDWVRYDHHVISGEPVAQTPEEVTAAVLELCSRYPKWELFHRGLDCGATLAPLNTLEDLLGFDHLEARSFWHELDDSSTRAPGAFFLRDGVRPAVKRGIQTTGSIEDMAPMTSTAPSGNPTASTVASTAGLPTDRLPLEGVNVVDFSWIGVGPITAKVLADHGANVIRIESENRIDGLRYQPPYKDAEPGVNRSNFFGSFNTSKRSLALDLKTESGRDIARRLTDWADLVIESFTPGAIDRLGLGYEDICKTNPSVIMVSTSLLGGGSPVSKMAGYGYHAAAIAGFQNLVGWPDLPPDGPWLAYTDTIGPRFIAPALLAAIGHREKTGEGCHLEAAQLEIALQLLAPELAEFQRSGEPLVRTGNRDANIAPQGVYPISGDDEWLAVSITNDESWVALVALLGHPTWATDPTLGTVEGRRAAHDLIDEELAKWTSGRDGAETEWLLADAGIAAGVVQGSGQLLADQQYAHRGFYAYLEHSEVGEVPYAGHQYRIDGYDHGPRHAAPCIGEHSYEVLSMVLGLEPEEIAEIAAADALV